MFSIMYGLIFVILGLIRKNLSTTLFYIALIYFLTMMNYDPN